MAHILCIGAGYVGGPTMAVIALALTPNLTAHQFATKTTRPLMSEISRIIIEE